MSEPTLWWLATAVAIGLELLSGTFYLLMLALGMAAAALCAHAGYGLSLQLLAAAFVGGGAVVAWHVRQRRRPAEPPAQANPNVIQDIGETVQVDHWNPDGTTTVHYRGAAWSAAHRAGATPATGPFRIAEMVGSRLILEKI